jgi:hypothetical protein
LFFYLHVKEKSNQYGKGEVNTYLCKSIQKQESTTSTKYILEECPNLEELLTISHDEDQEDQFDFELKYGPEVKGAYE